MKSICGSGGECRRVRPSGPFGLSTLSSTGLIDVLEVLERANWVCELAVEVRRLEGSPARRSTVVRRFFPKS
jgi:hypothetical protein